MIVSDVVIGLGIAALSLLNVYQFGRVREQRDINEANSLKLAAADLANKANAEKLVIMKQPVLITMTEQQVLGLANMLQSAFEALHPSTVLARRPN